MVILYILRYLIKSRGGVKVAKKRVTLDLSEKVKILGISFSGQKEGVTAEMVKYALDWAEAEGYAETEYISAADYNFYPCIGCKKCFGYRAPADDPPRCYEHPDDGSNSLMPKIIEVDGILIGFPTHARGLPSILNIFLEKSHQISQPLAFTRWAGAWRYKAISVIAQGSGMYTGQHLANAQVMLSFLDCLPARGGATADIPLPTLGSTPSTLDGVPMYGQGSFRKASGITVPPVMGSGNERGLKAAGRGLAQSALFMKIAREAFKEAELDAPEILPYTEYQIKPEPGSWVDKLMKEGKVKYVSEEELLARRETQPS